MASITKDKKTGRLAIQFVLPDKRRATIRLSSTSTDYATKFKQRVESLITAATIGEAPDDDTRKWAAKLWDKSPAYAEKLASYGLIQRRESGRLQPFLESFLQQSGSRKPSTLAKQRNTVEKLIEFFGADKLLRDIHEGDADAFAAYLDSEQGLTRRRGATKKPRKRDLPKGTGPKKLAEQTIRRRLGLAKQFFRAALRRKLIESNPFVDQKSHVTTNRKRHFFVGRDLTAKVFDALPDAEWRLIFALSRFGGLRCPSEHLALKWEDINVATNMMTVHATKTERHPSGERVMPIWDELKPHLNAVWDLAEPGNPYVITRYRSSNSNLRTQFIRYLKLAGIPVWPKVFQNLRATRSTELRHTPGIGPELAAKFLGHSEEIANVFYDIERELDFTKLGAMPTALADGALQNQTHSGALSDDQGDSSPEEKPANERRRAMLTTVGQMFAFQEVGGEGVELNADSSGNQGNSESSAAESEVEPPSKSSPCQLGSKSPGDSLPSAGPLANGDDRLSATDPELARLLALWPSLPPADRREVVSLAEAMATDRARATAEASPTTD